MVKRKMKEAEEELIKVCESEEVADALDDLKDALTNADKLEISEEEELDFSGAVEKVREALEELDIENKEEVVEALKCMENKKCTMSEDEIEAFADNVKKIEEEIEDLESKEELKESEESKEVEEPEEESKEELKESEESKEVEEPEEELEESVQRIFSNLNLTEDTKFAIKTLIESKVKEEEEKAIEKLNAKCEEYTDELNAKCEEYADELQKEKEKELAEEVEDLNQKADNYLSHVAEEWAEENKLAIKEGLKVQIAENFIFGLKKLLEENDIEIDDEKEDLVQETVEKCEKLQDKLDEVLASKAELQEQVKTLTRFKIIQESTRDLTQVQRDRLTKLLENVSYADENELINKIKVLKESYIAPAKAEQLNEQVSKKVASNKPLEEIDAYAKFISRTL